jgi:NADH-quinone oxidoreductase subunit N
MTIPAHDFVRFLPELILTFAGVLVMSWEPLLAHDASRRPLGYLAFLGALAALVASVYQVGFQGEAFLGMLRVDAFSIFFHVIIIAVAALVILGSFDYLEAQQIRKGEYYALILFGTVGMVLMSSAVELVLIFIALEISSISTYILAGFRKRVATSAESAIKYFLLGSFATAFLLYGVALMFGATGSTNIYTIAGRLASTTDEPGALVYAAIALMFVGLGFKVASAPFHVWTPDVYEGAPAPVVALMSTAPKTAAFAVLLRVLLATGAPGWFWMVWISAALSMTLGNLGALAQTNIKRMLAYSSIAHAGYLLVAFAASRELGASAAIFYAAAYAAMNAGAFLVVAHVAAHGERRVSLDDYAGMAQRSPLLAATLTAFLLSLIGIPLTAGFFAKFYVFRAALDADLVGLTVIGLVNSGIAAYYYLRVIVMMYMREPDTADAMPAVGPALAIALAVSVALVVYLGIAPGSALAYATESARALLR